MLSETLNLETMLIRAKNNFLRIVLIKVFYFFCDIRCVLKKAKNWQNSNWRVTPSWFLLIVIHANHQDLQWPLFFKFNCTKQVSQLESIICSKKFECSNIFYFSSKTLNVWNLCSFNISFVFCGYALFWTYVWILQLLFYVSF